MRVHRLVSSILSHGPLQAAGGGVFLSAISSDGQFGTVASPGSLPAYSTAGSEFTPETAPITVGRTRAGYDSSCNAAVFSEPVIVTRRTRQAYTTSGAATHLLGSASTVALDSSVWQTDTMASGCTNGSTELSPKPIAQWQMRNRKVCGDTLRLELVAFHISARGGKPVAGAKAWVTDGTTATTPVLMTGPVVLSGPYDLYPVIGYYADINTSGYSDGTVIQGNAQVFPRIGGSGSVLDSSTGTLDARGFTPQGFYKHTARFNTPIYVYVDPVSGVDAVVLSSGAVSAGPQKVSATAATAKANPFLTKASAINALKAATTLTGGFTDGCRVRLMAGTHSSATNAGAGTYQVGGELIVEGDPTVVDPTTIIYNPGTNYRQSWLTYKDLAIVRANAIQMSTLAGGRLSLVNIANFDAGGQSSALWNNVPLTIEGMTASSLTGSTLVNGSWPLTLVRGLKAGTFLSATQLTIDGYNLTSCDLKNFLTTSFGGRDPSGGIHAFYVNLGISLTSFSVSLAGTVNGFARVQYVEEFSAGVSNPMTRPSGDGNLSNINHFLDWYGSQSGASLYGRRNEGYDETPSVYRVHRHWQRRGTIPVASYIKSDWFLGSDGNGTANPTDAPNHINAWGVMYGVNDMGNLHQFPADSGTGPTGNVNGDRTPAFYGMFSKVGTSKYVPIDPLYNNAAYTARTTHTRFDGTTVTAGTGPSTASLYTVPSGSPAKGIVPYSALPFDLTGTTARPTTNDTAGAYVAP